MLGGVVAAQGDVDLPLMLAARVAGGGGRRPRELRCSAAGSGAASWSRAGRGSASPRRGSRASTASSTRHGAKAILVGRFVGIVRAVAPFLAGASGMRLRAFLPWSLLGTAAWAATFTLVGYVFHASFSAAADYVTHGALRARGGRRGRARMAGASFATIPGVTTPAELATDDDERSESIVGVLADAFGDLIEADERAFRHKFRKMAASPFAFYRGSAPLFYADVVRLEDPWADERTSRVWIQGDLHAENFGTYMDSAGILVFDVNDFDEAYVGHFTWDLRRMAASLALLGFAKALSDEAIERMIETYGRAYLEQVRAFATGDRDSEYRLTLDNTDGVLNDVLLRARLETRVALLDATTTVEGAERHFSAGVGCAAARGRRARRGRAGVRGVPRDDPRGQAPAQRLLRGQGRGRPRRVRDRLGRACRPTACWSRAARRRSRTTSCSR